MPEKFDPDSWPSPSSHTPSSGGAGNRSGVVPPRPNSYDDDYESLAFDSPSANYGANNYDQYFDDDEFSNPSRNNSRSGPARDPYRDDFDTDYESEYNDYDNSYDDYDTFDREPSSDNGVGRKILAGLAVIFVVGAIGVLTSSVLRDSGGDQTASDGQTENSSDTGTDGAQAGATNVTAPDEVIQAMDAALVAWGKFAADGNLETVKPHFAANGPQLLRLEADAPNIQAKPGPVLQMSMTNATHVKATDDWLIKGTVEVAATGEKIQNYPWEIRMTQQSEDEPWQILSIHQY